jgi:hypothetical protein
MITRSIETKLLQGIKLALLADSDIGDKLKFAGGVNIGPLTPDPTKGDQLIVPRQINLMIAPNIEFEANRTSGISDSAIPVVIAFYDFMTYEASDAVSPNLLPWDYFEHIQKVLMKGSDGNNQGKIVNPDDPNNVSAVHKYLNTAAPGFRTIVMGTVVTIDSTDSDGQKRQDAVARCYAMIAGYETQQDIITRDRA